MSADATSHQDSSRPRVSRRAFFIAGLLVTVLVAGFVSYYASSHPDGLNFVAEKHGFIAKEKESKAADSPFAGYSTKGVDNDRLSGGLAGVAGAGLVLVLMTGLGLAVRRRGSDDGDEDAAGGSDASSTRAPSQA